MTRAVLIANGALYDVGYARALLRPDDVVIAANGGTKVAFQLGRRPDVVVGDLDSLSPELHGWLADGSTPVVRHPRDKDATDLELALDLSIQRGAERLLLLGATGSRLDHSLANISLLALAHRAGVKAEVVVARQHLHLVVSELQLEGEAGQTVSLLPWGGDARGVRSQRLRWELDGADLPFGPSRGVSNEMVGDTARVRVEQGLLLVVQQRGAVV